MLSVPDADALAQLAHGDDRNRSGELFIDHVRSVARRMKNDPDPYAVLAALLHDTVEKSSMTWDDLRAAGADDRLVALVDALTERDDEPEEEYLDRAAADPLTLRIKRADITDKLDLDGPTVLSDDARRTMEDRARRRLDLLEEKAQRRAAPQ